MLCGDPRARHNAQTSYELLRAYLSNIFLETNESRMTLFPLDPAPDRNAKLFVWGMWLAMLIADLLILANHGRNIPEAEDWHLVPPLTGWESNLGDWLWAQNNEHRIPLPRLILLTALNLTKGDFRSGAVLNIFTLAFVAAAGILVARHLRGKRTSYADAFFPLALLNIGNWPWLVWSWMFTFILPTTLIFTLLFVFVVQPTLTAPAPAAIAAISLILLPLCGANGLIFLPFIAIWLVYRGLVNWRTSKSTDNQQWVSAVLIGSAIVASSLAGIYFIGYQQPAWNPPSPGIGATLLTAGKFLAYSLGAVAAESWKLFTLIAAAIIIPTLLVILASKRQEHFDKQRSIAILLFFGTLLIFAIAIGYGRAGSIPQWGFPIRYVILAAPLLYLVFFVWELYGSRKWQKLFQVGLFVLMSLLLPFNSRAGFKYFGNWYDGAMDAVERDIEAGMCISELSKRHRKNLVHWFTEGDLEKYMQMLYDYRVGPFAHIKQRSCGDHP